MAKANNSTQPVAASESPQSDSGAQGAPLIDPSTAGGGVETAPPTEASASAAAATAVDVGAHIPGAKRAELAKKLKIAPHQVIGFRADGDRTIVVVQTEKSVEKREIKS